MIKLTIEEQLKTKILDQYKSVRAFTQEIDIPYSTVDTLFKRGIYGTGVSTILKIFKALDLDVESISTGELKPKTKNAPAAERSESDIRKSRLIHNYDQLNELGQDTLVTYSDDIASMPKYTDEPSDVKKQA